MPSLALASLNLKPAERLLIAPQDIRTADPTIATEIYSGYFAMAGKVVDAQGRSPFEIDSGSPDWQRELAGFSWLRHLRAADTALARANARALVDDFLSGVGTAKDATAWEAPVVIRRTLSFLVQSPIILEGADASLYRRFMRGLARSQRVLEYQIAAGLTGETRLFTAIALAELGLCAQTTPKDQRRSSKLLADELEAQILPDGGHISRNPQILIDLLLDLLPLRQVYTAAAVAAPAQLLNAIDRILPMLRLLLHGDGTLAHFNGMGVTAPDLLATVLAYDDARAKALSNAPHSGYVRVEAQDAALIVDTGRPPPAAFSKRAHAGCLAFEFSIGLNRLVVNCGAPDITRKNAREAARMTAAHSTLVVADRSSCRFAGSRGFEKCLEGQILAGPRHVGVERENLADATVLSLSHDGYAPTFGLVHERRLMLDANGRRLEGHDALKPAKQSTSTKPVAFAVRFHIHPSVGVESTEEGRAVLLRLPDGSRWFFDAQNLPLEVEESIFFAAADGPHACQQIAIHGRTDTIADIGWTFRCLEEAPTRDADV
ncbi:MAG: heparinase II/III family protein [Beijerinckiaceae bacterium]